MVLKGLGCRVELMSLGTHPGRVTGVLDAVYEYDPLRPIASLRRAIEESKPETVIPADELALMHLGELVREVGTTAPGTRGGVEGLRALVDRSVGGMRVISAAESRMELLRIAESEHVATPETVEVETEDELRAAVAGLGLPLVLKADATSGGQGVRVAATAQEATKGWRMLMRPPSLVRALKRGFVSGEWTHLRPWAKRTTRGVTAQRFVQGTERTGMAVCRRGEVLAMVCLEVEEHWCERGPSSVVRVIDDTMMEMAMRRIAGRLGVTGFCGFDFMVEPGSGTPLLIEMNPRPTQLVHLALGPGRDLAAAYVREILGQDEVQDREAVTEKDRIAVFPQELQRDPAGALLGEVFHDVPWESSALMQRALGTVPEILMRDARWGG